MYRLQGARMTARPAGKAAAAPGRRPGALGTAILTALMALLPAACHADVRCRDLGQRCYFNRDPPDQCDDGKFCRVDWRPSGYGVCAVSNGDGFPCGTRGCSGICDPQFCPPGFYCHSGEEWRLPPARAQRSDSQPTGHLNPKSLLLWELPSHTHTRARARFLFRPGGVFNPHIPALQI